MEPSREQLFEDYETTIVLAQHPHLGWVDPGPVAAMTRRSAVVMTAWNPGHERPTEVRNREANTRLGRELEDTGFEVWRADGSAPDGTWLEEGWIIWDMLVDQGLDIASRYQQFAIYGYDEDGRRVTIACPS